MFHNIKLGALEYATADALDGCVHCFSTRLGGVSEGELASMNLGPGRGDSLLYPHRVEDPEPAALEEAKTEETENPETE